MVETQDIINLTVRLVEIGASNIYCDGDGGISFVVDGKIFCLGPNQPEDHYFCYETSANGHYNRTTDESQRICALLNESEGDDAGS